jgi:hypothetical protein
MARPRIFISSTFFDLRQLRSDIDRFIRDLGYEPVRNEQGNIPYGKDEKIEEYCYKEINNIDILVSIIGSKFGSKSSHDSYSISQMEIITALKLDKQVFIFIDKNVLSEFRTYLVNKANRNIKYHYVDNPRIYEFIEQLEELPKNNPIQAFESSDDIIHFLREQWAGLFHFFLQEQKRLKEINLLQGIENTAKTLNQLIDYLTIERKGTEDVIKDILISNHPAFERLKRLLSIPHRLFFLTREELTQWLKTRKFERVEVAKWDNPKIEEWALSTSNNRREQVLKVNSVLFDINGNLKPMHIDNWNEYYINLEFSGSGVFDMNTPINDFPFGD